LIRFAFPAPNFTKGEKGKKFNQKKKKRRKGGNYATGGCSPRPSTNLRSWDADQGEGGGEPLGKERKGKRKGGSGKQSQVASHLLLLFQLCVPGINHRE